MSIFKSIQFKLKAKLLQNKNSYFQFWIQKIGTEISESEISELKFGILNWNYFINYFVVYHLFEEENPFFFIFFTSFNFNLRLYYVVLCYVALNTFEMEHWNASSNYGFLNCEHWKQGFNSFFWIEFIFNIYF